MVAVDSAMLNVFTKLATKAKFTHRHGTQTGTHMHTKEWTDEELI